MTPAQIVKEYIKCRSDGAAAGFMWARDNATIGDLERIYDTTFDGQTGYAALGKALNMTNFEIMDVCFAGDGMPPAFADGFCQGALNYFDEVLEASEECVKTTGETL